MDDRFRLTHAHLRHFRGFEDTKVDLTQTTVVFGENGCGKTALLRGLAIGIAAAFDRAPVNLLTDDIRLELRDLVFSPTGDTRVELGGSVGGVQHVWSRTRELMSTRTSNADCKDLRATMRRVWRGVGDWPVFGFYGTQRLWGRVNVRYAGHRASPQRTQAYQHCLDPRSSESKLLVDLVWRAAFAELRGQQNLRLKAVELALIRATTKAFGENEGAIRALRLDPNQGEPVIEFADGRTWLWSWLSDGFHVFLGLVADIAVRSTLANPHLGEEAPNDSHGTVLIDEVDLHLHPRLKRNVIGALRAAFPKIQFIVTTHSPQVLASAKNEEVVNLDRSGQVRRELVGGRDSNSVLAVMGDRDRPSQDDAYLNELYADVDRLDSEPDPENALKLERQLDELEGRWGTRDTEVIKLRTALAWAKAQPSSD